MKQAVEQLALFGGRPAFDEPLHVGRPNIGNREQLLARFNDMLDRRWLSNNGRYVQEFEQRIATLLGVRHCIAMCNATVALEIAIRALGLHGEVIVPSYTFIATAHALQWQQITPVFCDVDAHTHNIDPARVEALITPRTTGIVGVHVWGNTCDLLALEEIARRHKLRLLYDAAHAFACSWCGRMIGNFGDAEVFSFHATKFLNTFEGGAVVTNDDQLAHIIRLMKNFGFVNYDQVEYIGTNGKMSEIAAAMGLTSLESLDDFIATNRHNYHRYQEQLGDIAGVRFVTYDEAERHNYQYIVLEIDSEVTGLTRDQLTRILWAEQVLARRYFYPGCHRMEPYRTYFPHAGRQLPVTEALSLRTMQLPNGTAVSDDDIDGICQIIRFAISHSHEIRQKELT